jgi:long-chain acyl-CoA synthetase
MNTLINIIQNISSSYSSKTALQIKEGESYFRVTYQELQDSAQKIALSLKELGVKKSDTVGLITENSPYWGMAFFGILWAGGAVVPIDNKLKEHSILNIVEHSQCKIIFTSSNFKESMERVSKESSYKPRLVILDGKPSKKEELSLQELITNGKERFGIALEKIKSDDLAIILYTSGTTGSPKGVMLTHGNIASNVESVSSIFPFSPNDHLISVLPLCHTYAITGDLLICLYNGATSTYLESLKGPILIERMIENKATVLVAVPALIQMMYHQLIGKLQALPKAKRFIFKTLKGISKLFFRFGFPIGHVLFKSMRDKMSPRLRFFISGGAPIDPKIIQEFSILGIPIYQGYGLTETSPILTVNTPAQNKIGSVGRPIPGVQIKIEKGEILARGPNIMKGYYKYPEATSEVLKNGWLYTGDLGFFDSEGFLHISGRLKNVIITRGGKNVYPEELEEELCRSPLIKEACILGLKKEAKGFTGDEQVYAIIIPNKEALESAGIQIGETLKNHPQIEAKISEEIKRTNTRLADYKRIRGFEIWDELPKTTTLKIKRKEIREIFQQRGIQPVGGEI